MRPRIKNLAVKLLTIAFWILIWEVSAYLIGIDYIFPHIHQIVEALIGNLGDISFWLIVLASLARIVLGFILGVASALLLAIVSSFFRIFHDFLSPLVLIARCTPVASFIMILWLLPYTEGAIPTLIAILMVFPVIYENAYNGLINPDKQFIELASVYGLNNKSKLMYITFPLMIKSTLPAIITASGLAWKAGIAAEIITYTDFDFSIGKEIAIWKNEVEGAELLSWTLVVILLSIFLEFCIKRASKEVSKLWE